MRGWIENFNDQPPRSYKTILIALHKQARTIPEVRALVAAHPESAGEPLRGYCSHDLLVVAREMTHDRSLTDYRQHLSIPTEPS